MPAKPAACPHCELTMLAVHARARSGYCLLLDQCGQCGGVWCDRWELYPLDADEAQRIDPVDTAGLQAESVTPRRPGRCPRCTVALRPFRDPGLPVGARIERCAVCDGMWLNRGELRRIKQHAPARRTVVDAALLARVGAQLGASTSWAQVSNLDAATYTPDPSLGDDLPSWRDALSGSGPWAALASLLGLLWR
jgi:Zn-finger nucleic acid-binding protein